MKLRVGDKVGVTKDFLLKLPHFTDRVKDGGVIIRILEDEARVEFYSGRTYDIFLSSLKLKYTKNQQLLFSFMD